MHNSPKNWCNKKYYIAYTYLVEFLKNRIKSDYFSLDTTYREEVKHKKIPFG